MSALTTPIYLLIDPDTPHVARYQRLDDGAWRFTATVGLAATLTLASLGMGSMSRARHI